MSDEPTNTDPVENNNCLAVNFPFTFLFSWNKEYWSDADAYEKCEAAFRGEGGPVTIQSDNKKGGEGVIVFKERTALATFKYGSFEKVKEIASKDFEDLLISVDRLECDLRVEMES